MPQPRAPRRPAPRPSEAAASRVAVQRRSGAHPAVWATAGFAGVLALAWAAPRSETWLNAANPAGTVAAADDPFAPSALSAKDLLASNQPRPAQRRESAAAVDAPAPDAEPVKPVVTEPTDPAPQEDSGPAVIVVKEEPAEDAPDTAALAANTEETDVPIDGTPLWLTRPPVPETARPKVSNRLIEEPPLANLDKLRAEAERLPTNPANLRPEQRLTLLQWDLAERTGAEPLKELAKTEEGRRFLATLGEDAAWMRDLLDNGTWTKKADTVLTHLFALLQADSQVELDPPLRSMANALALTAYGKDQETALLIQRQEYYAHRYRIGRLNSRFETLLTWERLWLAWGSQGGYYNKIPNMEYFNDHAAVSIKEYIPICWRAPYRTHNWYGDYYQTPHYYGPFAELYSKNIPQMALEVGGVCGTLSNYGAGAALANGIPAVILNEPDHCAYAVLTEPGVMERSYSMSWKRTVDFSVWGVEWGDHRAWEMAYADVNRQAQARELDRLARALVWRGVKDPQSEGVKWNDRYASEADKLWQAAIGINPMDQGLWTNYARFGKQTSRDKDWWRVFHSAVVSSFGKQLSEVAWRWSNQAKEQFVKMGGSEEERLELELAYHQAVGTDWGEIRWDLAQAVADQLEKIPSEDQKAAFLAKIMPLYLERPALIGDVIKAGSESFGTDNKGKFVEFVTLAASQMDGEKGEEVMESLARQVMSEAEEQGDRETFQRFGKMVGEEWPEIDIEAEPFEGELLSSGGMLRVSGVGNDNDKPAAHWGVLELHGGFFHTGGQTNQATVELGNYGELSGINLVQRPEWRNRLVGCTVEASMDGESWETIHTVANDEMVYPIDLSGKAIRAKFIRLTNEKEVLHLRQILVYGRRLN